MDVDGVGSFDEETKYPEAGGWGGFKRAKETAFRENPETKSWEPGNIYRKAAGKGNNISEEQCPFG